MEPTHSFAPFAARLAGHAAALRPAQDGRDGLGPAVMATVWLLLLEFLIRLCEALDVRAAAEAVAAAGAIEAAAVPAPRAARPALPGETRATRLALAPQVLAPRVQATTPTPADAPFGTVRRPAAGPWLAWARDSAPVRAVVAPRWRPR